MPFILGLAACSSLPVLPALAQRGGERSSDRSGTPRVMLLVRPRVGDTLHLEVEQSVTVGGRRVDASPNLPASMRGTRDNASAPAPAAPDYGPRVDRANARVTRVQLYARSLVESSDLSATTLSTTTDSVTAWTGNVGDPIRAVHMPVAAANRVVRLRVTPDGAMRAGDSWGTSAGLGATLASVPGLLPAGAVSVGSEWQREFALPPLPLGTYRAEGVVQARLRLDSLSRNGTYAYVSVLGDLRRDGAAPELPAGTRVITAGTLQGTMVIDRDRAWITDARTVIDVQSEVAPGPAGTGKPMLLDIRIQQRVRVR
ncbi:hypothetical protein [Gemmatimonas sp.]